MAGENKVNQSSPETLMADPQYVTSCIHHQQRVRSIPLTSANVRFVSYISSFNQGIMKPYWRYSSALIYGGVLYRIVIDPFFFLGIIHTKYRR